MTRHEDLLTRVTTTLSHPDGSVEVTATPNGLCAITVTPRRDLFVPITTWTTAYPIAFIEHALRVKGPAYVCDELMREDSPRYIQHSFEWDLLSYVDPSAFADTSILDFGSGSGASSLVLARMFPKARIVGVELQAKQVELARHRAVCANVTDRVTFQCSPNAERLPEGLGTFDYILFSAVYEHLLPAERATMLPRLWTHLKPGGLLFLNQTPHRWFPIDLHTTGLPLINYLPDWLALPYARGWSTMVHRDATWTDLLRNGIRGGTPHEILSHLPSSAGLAELMEPSHRGVTDHIDLWYQLSNHRAKQWVGRGLRALKAVTGLTLVPSLSLAIRKGRALSS